MLKNAVRSDTRDACGCASRSQSCRPLSSSMRVFDREGRDRVEGEVTVRSSSMIHDVRLYSRDHPRCTIHAAAGRRRGWSRAAGGLDRVPVVVAFRSDLSTSESASVLRSLAVELHPAITLSRDGGKRVGALEAPHRRRTRHRVHASCPYRRCCRSALHSPTRAPGIPVPWFRVREEGGLSKPPGSR
jgi:hypothetical protein